MPWWTIIIWLFLGAVFGMFVTVLLMGGDDE